MKKRCYVLSLVTLIPIVCLADSAAVTATSNPFRPSNNLHPHKIKEVSEPQLQRFEQKMLGSGHAAEHAGIRAEHNHRPKLETLSLPGPAEAIFDKLLGFLRPDRLDSVTQSLGRMLGTAQAAVGAPNQVGAWAAPIPVPIVGIHSVLLATGKVLFLSYHPGRPDVNLGVAYVWDPITGIARQVDPPNNLFCAGQTLLPDGRVLVVGGNLAFFTDEEDEATAQGLNQIYTFNPFTETWTRQPDMRQGRWYPSVTTLPDGRAVITSGYDETGRATIDMDIEIFTPSADMDGEGTLAFVGSRVVSGLYPQQFVLPDGTLLMAGPGQFDVDLFDPADNTVSMLPPLLENRYRGSNGILLPGSTSGSTQIMMIGGAFQDSVTATTERFDSANPTRGWEFRASMPEARHNANTVILPDGKLLTVGGNSDFSNYLEPQREAQLYDPLSNTWQPMATHQEQRAYHSTALLLPDGRVLSAGDDDPLHGGTATDLVEVFSPPYLFRGARPVIGSAPSLISWGANFTISTSDTVSQAVLIAPGAVTHGNDANQRYVPLTVSPTPGGVSVIAPTSANIAPPGHYMLFILNDQAVPSVASWVTLGASSDSGNTIQFSTPTLSVNEDSSVASISVTRIGDNSGIATVDYSTDGGTATEGVDYTAVSGTLTFAAASIAAQTFTVPIIDDTDVESNEIINLTLRNPTGDAALGMPGSIILTITDNDSAPSPPPSSPPAKGGEVGGGGGGCSLSNSTSVDPLLPLLLSAALIYLLRRRSAHHSKSGIANLG